MAASRSSASGSAAAQDLSPAAWRHRDASPSGKVDTARARRCARPPPSPARRSSRPAIRWRPASAPAPGCRAPTSPTRPSTGYQDRAPARRRRLLPCRGAIPIRAAWPVVGGDHGVAGTVTDVWVDRSEYLARYYELELAGERRTPRARARQLRQARQAAARIFVARAHADHFAGVPATKAPDQRHAARGRQDLRLFRRRHSLRHPAPHGAAAMSGERFRAAFPGLPERLPPGRAHALAGRARLAPARHPRLSPARAVAIYFARCWRLAPRSGLVDGEASSRRSAPSRFLLPRSALGVARHHRGLLLGARHALHHHRPAHRHAHRHRAAGDANIPFAPSTAPACSAPRRHGRHLAASSRRGDRIAYLSLWPHVRPWRLARPEPMLRCIRNPERSRRSCRGARRQRDQAAPPRAVPQPATTRPPAPPCGAGILRRGGDACRPP